MRGPLGLPVAFVATTTAIALPYWAATFDSIRDDGIFGSWHLIAGMLVAGTLLAGMMSEVSLGLVLTVMLTCAPIAVIGRVIIDSASQPTSHNLWPLELVIAAVMSIPFVGIGAAFAWGARRLMAQ